MLPEAAWEELVLPSSGRGTPASGRTDLAGRASASPACIS